MEKRKNEGGGNLKKLNKNINVVREYEHYEIKILLFWVA